MARHLHGRYTILGKLADGGMAEIFLAVQHGAEGFQKPVVLKRILTQYSADPQFRNMLLDEAHISMSLQHSNIVQVLDLGVAAGRYFLVLELVDGWDLERILQRAVAVKIVWPPALGLYVTTQVCRALAYAHNKVGDGKPLGIVHRDISPNNVLISDQGEVKLADFGIAKAQRKREQTAAGVIKGKVAYMSPEQALGGSGIDKRSDIFSVGSMMYRMMTDKLPFDSGNDLESLLRVQKAQFAPPEEAKPTVGSAVSSIIMRAMRLVPGERYQSGEEMLTDVERVLRNEFHSAGQTELKLWLEQLGRRDEIESIGKRRLDSSTGVVKDVLGTDLSAGTSFELDDLEVVGTSQTDISVSPPTPPPGPRPGPPPLPRPETAVIAPAPVPPRRRRFSGFWVGALFALGAVVGIRYLIGWAQEQGMVDRLGLGPDGPVRSLVGGASGGGAAAARAPVASPSRPMPKPMPTPAPVPAATPAPAPAVAPTVTAATGGKDAAGEPAGALAVAEPARGAGTAATAGESPAPADKPAADDEPDEEALLRDAVPNSENAVIGEEEAEPAPTAKPGAPAEADKAHATVARTATHAAASKPEPPTPTAKPAAAKPATVVLHIFTRPVGAVVRTKSRVLGRTPINLHFKTGNTYELIFLKRGYQPTTKRVSLSGSKDRKVAVALRKRPTGKRHTFFHPHR